MKKYLTIFIILCFIQCFTFAMPAYHFKQVDITHGLSKSKVTSICYDYKGYLWIGTRYGLNCFDRDEIKQFFTDSNTMNSLPSNEIVFIEEDMQKNLWIGTSKGICLFNRTRSDFKPVMFNNRTLKASSILLEGDGVVFGGISQLFKYSYATKRIEKLPIKSDDKRYINYTELTDLGTNCILINTTLYGIFQYDKITTEIRQLSYIPQGGNQKIFVDSNKRIWVSEYGKGISCYENEHMIHNFNTVNSPLTCDVILSLQEKNGDLWLGTDGGGINIISLADFSFKHIKHTKDDLASYPANAVNCLYKDPMGNMWTGTVRNGVVCIYETTAKSYKNVPLHNPYGLSTPSINCIFEDEIGNIWLGTDGGGLNLYNPITHKFTHYDSLKEEKVTSIASYSSQELLLFLFNNGLYLFNKQKGTIRPFRFVEESFNDMISINGYSVFIHSLDKNRLMFSGQYLIVYDKSTQKAKIIGEKGLDFSRNSPLIREAPDGTIFIIDQFKIYKYNPKNQKLITCFSCEYEIQDVTIDYRNDLWIGTLGGLLYYSPQNGKKRVVRPDIFKSINSVVASKNDYLWIGSSSNRLLLYNIESDLLSLMGESEGFIPNEYTFGSTFAASTGEVYLGGAMGLTITNSDISLMNDNESDIVLMDVWVNGEPYWGENIRNGQKITLPWNFSSLQLKLMVKDDNIFRKHAFQYIITSPQKEEIIHSFNHSLKIHYLQSGTHIISVSYITPRGVWSKPINIAYVEVVPPWWKSTLFYLGMLLIVLVIFITITFGLINHEEKKRKDEIDRLNKKVSQDRIRFLVNIGHELRTPLTLISAPLKQIIDNETEPSAIIHKLDNIYKQSIKMKELVDMVLDVKKLKDGEEVLHLAPYHLNSWIKESLEQFEDEMHHRSIRLRYEFDESIDLVPFDKDKCNLVISNLVMNAIKFSDDHTTITISTQKTGSDMIRVSVIDEGIGVQDEDIPNLFSLYYQGNNEKSGSCIGLSYCKSLIDLHNGRVGVFRNRDVGSTFYFELPLTPENITSFEAEIAVQSTIEKDAYDILKPCSVMIVVEKSDLRNYLKDTLKHYFTHVYWAKDGVEGFTQIQRFSPDIVVSDAIMSRMNGFMLCRKMKKDDSTNHIPIVLLTAYYNQTNMQTGYRMGADAFICKPFEMDTLLSISCNQLHLRKALKQRYQGTEVNNTISKEVLINNADEKFMEKLNKVIEDNLQDANLNVDFLTKAMCISRTALFNKIKNVTDLGIIDYINNIRIQKAIYLLENTTMNITEISEKLGFSYPQYFGKVFKKQMNLSPSEYRNKFKK